MKTLALVTLVVLLAGCSGPKHVSVAEFKKEFAAIGQPQSVRHIEYLGVRDGKVFMKVSAMRAIGGKWKEQLIFVELAELDEAFRATLPEKPNQSPEPTSGLRPAVAHL